MVKHFAILLFTNLPFVFFCFLTFAYLTNSQHLICGNRNRYTVIKKIDYFYNISNQMEVR